MVKKRDRPGRKFLGGHFNEYGRRSEYRRLQHCSVTPGESLPPDYDKVLALLISEGYLDEDERSFTITYKGRSKLNEGGFLGEYRRKIRNRILERIGIIVGIITGIAGLVCSILALV